MCGLFRSNLALATAGPPRDSDSFAVSLQTLSHTKLLRGGGMYLLLLRELLRTGDSLAPGLRNDLLGNCARDLCIAVELHRVHRTTLRLRTQIADIPEHLRERH